MLQVDVQLRALQRLVQPHQATSMAVVCTGSLVQALKQGQNDLKLKISFGKIYSVTVCFSFLG